MPLKLTYRLKSESIVRWFLDREIENKSREREREESESRVDSLSSFDDTLVLEIRAG